MPGPLDNPREFREFVRAKRNKGEALRMTARACAAADFRPRDARAFSAFIARMRGTPDWGQAMEAFDRLEYALRMRHAVAIPFPRLLSQNEDGSLTLFWGTDLLVRIFPVGTVFSFMGQRRKLEYGQETERVLLDALRAKSPRN